MKKIKKMQKIIFRGIAFMNIFAFIVIFLTIISILFNNTTTMLKESRMKVLRQVSERIRIINNIAVYSSNSIYDQFSDYFTDDIINNHQSLSAEIEDSMSSTNMLLKDIQMDLDVMIILNNGYVYYSEGESESSVNSLKTSFWYMDNYSNDESEAWLVRFDNIDNIVKMKVSYGKIIRDENGVYLGVIISSISEKTFNEIYTSVSEERNNIFILDSTGKAISHSRSSLVGTDIYYMPTFFSTYGKTSSTLVKKNTAHVIQTNVYDEATGWTIVEEMDVRNIMESYANLLYFGIALLIFSIGVALLNSAIISKRLSNPLRNMKNDMVSSSENSFAPIELQTNYDEIFILGKIFNQNIDRMNDLIKRIKKEERQKRKFELDFLQAQINPHFLHNTLFSIKCLVEMQCYNRAGEMLHSLTKLIKYPINTEKLWVPFYDEIDYIYSYIELMRNRYEFPIFINVDDTIDMTTLIPRFILQPIVENSIFHGYDSKTKAAQINITAYEMGEKFIIRVSDDGKGMAQTDIDRLWDNNASPSAINRIGLKNINARIKLIYGKEYGINILSELGKGTDVIITIGKRAREGNDE